MLKKSFTTHQVSRFFNVYPTTVIKWIKTGILPAYTTPGGHRRIKYEDILKLMKENNTPLPPELEKGEKYKILTIDDKPNILKMINSILSAEGDFEVRISESGFKAGMIVSNWAPDIILLDFLMPDMDGFEVCATLKSNEKTKDIPVIAVTILSDELELKKIYKAGVIDHLQKPFTSEDLIMKVRKHINING